MSQIKSLLDFLYREKHTIIREIIEITKANDFEIPKGKNATETKEIQANALHKHHINEVKMSLLREHRDFIDSTIQKVIDPLQL